MLRRMEGDIHEKTKEVDRAVEQSGGTPNFIQKKMINRLAHRQGRVTEMTEKMREGLSQQAPGAPGDQPGPGR
jgi:hypothetical protein